MEFEILLPGEGWSLLAGFKWSKCLSFFHYVHKKLCLGDLSETALCPIFCHVLDLDKLTHLKMRALLWVSLAEAMYVPCNPKTLPQVYLGWAEQYRGLAGCGRGQVWDASLLRQTLPPARHHRHHGTRARQALTASSWCPHRAHSASRTTTRSTRPPAALTNSWQLVLSRTTSWKSLLLVPVLTPSPSTY